MTKLPYYIGHDHRLYEATFVAAESATALSPAESLDIYLLEHLDLRRRHYFNRPWRIDESGQYWDERDGKPFSVQFSHSRFLTPILARDAGYREWALFSDSDFLWLDSPIQLLNEVDDSKTVWVVPHNYTPEGTFRKIDGCVQTRYNRKLWSALVLWNLRSKYLPTVEMVNEADGSFLHGFRWMPDSEIGFLSERWHWCPHISPTTPEAIEAEAANRPCPISAIHFTLSTPNMPDHKPTPFDNLWNSSRMGWQR